MKLNKHEFATLLAQIQDNCNMGFMDEDEMCELIAQTALEQMSTLNSTKIAIIISIDEIKEIYKTLMDAPPTPERQKIIDELSMVIL